jgi:uncharacterized MnhB-related membrane protein
VAEFDGYGNLEKRHEAKIINVIVLYSILISLFLIITRDLYHDT